MPIKFTLRKLVAIFCKSQKDIVKIVHCSKVIVSDFGSPFTLEIVEDNQI